ncbi:MAG: hypothetical protein WCR06_07495 [bacterium]
MTPTRTVRLFLAALISTMLLTSIGIFGCNNQRTDYDLVLNNEGISALEDVTVDFGNHHMLPMFLPAGGRSTMLLVGEETEWPTSVIAKWKTPEGIQANNQVEIPATTVKQGKRQALIFQFNGTSPVRVVVQVNDH